MLRSVGVAVKLTVKSVSVCAASGCVSGQNGSMNDVEDADADVEAGCVAERLSEVRC